MSGKRYEYPVDRMFTLANYMDTQSCALEAELSQTRMYIESLEQKRVDDNLFLSTLESEKTRLENDNDDLTVRLETLQRDMAESNSQAELALHEAEETYNSKELQLRSTIVQLEEDIELHRKDLAASCEKNNMLSDQHDHLQGCLEEAKAEAEKSKQDAVKLDGLCASLKERLTEAEHEICETKQSVVHKEADLGRIEKKACALQEDLDRTQHKLKQAIEDFEDLQTRYQELSQSSAIALQEVEAQSKIDLELAVSEHAEKHDQLQVSGCARSQFGQCTVCSRSCIDVA